jgi:hypothetical protein
MVLYLVRVVVDWRPSGFIISVSFHHVLTRTGLAHHVRCFGTVLISSHGNLSPCFQCKISIHDMMSYSSFYNRQVGTVLCINVPRSRTYMVHICVNVPTERRWDRRRVSSKFLGPIMCFNLWSGGGGGGHFF